MKMYISIHDELEYALGNASTSSGDRMFLITLEQDYIAGCLLLVTILESSDECCGT